MSNFTYPQSDLDNRQALLAIVGSFWNNTYQGNDLVGDLLYARAQLDAQTFLNMQELIASISRYTVPVYHRDNWYALELEESDDGADNIPLYDGTYNYDGTISYDVPVGTNYHVWALPPNLVDAQVILNRLSAASLVLIYGIDYFIRNEAIWFRDDLFNNPLVPTSAIFEGNEVIDRSCTLWAYRSQWEQNTIYQQFGYVLGLSLPSSSSYRNLVNAVFDGLVQGTTVQCIEQVFSAICDVPLAKGNETVETIFVDPRHLWVVTDQSAYAFDPGATVIVMVGQALAPGDQMTDTLQFFEFNAGQVPAEIRALALGKGFLASGYFQDLVFENKTVPLDVDTSGPYTKVSFEVGGWPGDADQFWDDVHARGIAAGKTLAMLLDQRTNKNGQPTALALPSTINPLGFLLQNVFRNNAFVVRLRTETFGDNALGIQNARVLRRLIPPQTACILLVELTADDTITMDGPGDETAAGYQESVSVFLGNSISEAIDPTVYIKESVRCTQIGGQCL